MPRQEAHTTVGSVPPGPVTSHVTWSCRHWIPTVPAVKRIAAVAASPQHLVALLTPSSSQAPPATSALGAPWPNNYCPVRPASGWGRFEHGEQLFVKGTNVNLLQTTRSLCIGGFLSGLPEAPASSPSMPRSTGHTGTRMATPATEPGHAEPFLPLHSTENWGAYT